MSLSLSLSRVLPLFHVAQAGLAAYTGWLSYTSIVKLQQYEATSEKAAQYSNTAAHQLHKTRTTQASGALSTLCSLLSSTALIFLPASTSWEMDLTICVANWGATTFAYNHINDFWKHKAKVPFVQDFNNAITTSNQMKTSLAGLAISWGVALMLYAFMPYKVQAT